MAESSASTCNGHIASASTSNGSSEEDEMTQYKKKALNVVQFRIVFEGEDLNSDAALTFKPKMAYQIFGESESIFGYRNLSIVLNYLHNSCHCYLDIQTGGRIKKENIEADNIREALNPWLPSHYTVSCDDFERKVSQETHNQSFGDLVEKFQDSKTLEQFPNETIISTFQITKIDNVYLQKDFREFHERFETFIVWYIDAANFIDLDDEKWLIYYVYEKFEHPQTKKTYCSPIGFCSVYKFYAYPDLIRPRISQFFILPTHQRRGIGTRLYRAVVRDLRGMDKAIDVTVEEPTVEFKKIRDLDDCLIFQNEIDISNFFKIPLKQFLNIGKEKKVSRLQALRVYDILGTVYSRRISKDAYNNFIETIKNRLIEETEREQKPGKRFCNLERTAVSLNLDQKAQIDAEYNRRLEDIEPSVEYFEKHCQHN